MLKNISRFIILILSIQTAFAQDNLAPATAKLAQFEQSHFQEKLYMHTDKDVYIAGEILWFKLYLVAGTSHKLSDLSDVVYVEILDHQNNPVYQSKIVIKDGVGDGSAFLPVSLHSGNFKIRAYTNWMKNFDPGFYFEKSLTIINTVQQAEIQKTAQKKLPFVLQFFPEGGNLVSDVPCKIAFKATDEFGKGINFNGTLLNSLNQEIATFKPLKFGIGNFILNAKSDEKYKVKIKLDNGEEYLNEFMPVSTNACALKLSETASGEIDIHVVDALKSNELIYLIAHSQHETKIAQAIELKHGIADFRFNKDKLGNGITHITLFNEKMKPLCERLYFKRPEQKLILNVKTSESSYQQRQKVNVSISAEDEKGENLEANLSMSVFLIDSLSPTENAENILSYLWLSSDIKGNIENPAYYFQHETAEVDDALDNLLLTQGWRKFNWETILKSDSVYVKFKPEYKTNIITAKITDKQTGKPARDILAYLSVTKQKSHVYGAESDADGKLSFYTKPIFGLEELALQVKDQNDSLYKIEINDQFSKELSENELANLKLLPSFKKSLINRSIDMQVQNLYNSDKLKMFLKPETDTSMFYGKASDKNYQLDSYTRFPTMEDVLREYVPEVMVERRKENYKLTIYNVIDKIYLEGTPLILLDGFPVSDQNRLMSFDPKKIKGLDIVAKKYFIGPLSFGGILNFSSYKADGEGFNIDPNLLLINYEGLQVAREFYSPVYETADEKSSRLPDFRTSLLWSPEITLQNGEAHLDFYTSDLKEKFMVVLQGLSKSGAAGYTATTFNVQ